MCSSASRLLKDKQTVSMIGKDKTASQFRDRGPLRDVMNPVGHPMPRVPGSTFLPPLLLLSIVCLVIQGVLCQDASATGADRLHPLEPTDTSSPRATLQSFLVTMEDASQVFHRAMVTYRQEPGIFPSRPVRDHVDELNRLLQRANRCLDLSETPPAIEQTVGWQVMALLKEVLDRIELPPMESVPDDAAMQAAGLSRWTIPHTEITIGKVESGPRTGEYLFTPATLARAKEFYDRARHLPYKPGSWEGVYEFLIQYSVFVPPKLIDLLPAWAKARIGGQTVWQWLSLAVLLVLMALVLNLIYRWGHRRSRSRPEGGRYRRILFPVSLMLGSILLDALFTRMKITGEVYVGIATTLGIVFWTAAGWAVILTGNMVADYLIASPGIREKRIDAAMVRIGSKVLSVGIAILLLLEGARSLGVPVIPLLAGLGVGGLALALAAQSTIENLIAGLTLYIDRPVRVGDFCRFGDKLGTLEEIGLRSTRIRTLDDTVLTVSNADFAKQQLENFSQRLKFWYHPRIRLRSETPPDQVRYLLIEIQKLLQTHPRVIPDSARIRFAEFGTSSLDLDVFAYVAVDDFNRFLKVAEELHLRIMELVEQAGSKPRESQGSS